MKRERNGWRDLSYSRWHRSLPRTWHAYDLDMVEVCHRCGRPVLLTEVGHLQGSRRRDRTSGKRWLRRMAEALGVPAVELYYLRDRELTDAEWRTLEAVSRIDWPRPAVFFPGHVYCADGALSDMPPSMQPVEWAAYISAARKAHRCTDE